MLQVFGYIPSEFPRWNFFVLDLKIVSQSETKSLALFYWLFGRQQEFNKAWRRGLLDVGFIYRYPLFLYFLSLFLSLLFLCLFVCFFLSFFLSSFFSFFLSCFLLATLPRLTSGLYLSHALIDFNQTWSQEPLTPPQPAILTDKYH